MSTPSVPRKKSSVGPASESASPVPPPTTSSLTPTQRDSCLRVLNMKSTADAQSAHKEASNMFPGKPVEALLYQALRVSHERTSADKNHVLPTLRTHVYRDFSRLHQQLRHSARPNSLLVAARNVLDRVSHMDDNDDLGAGAGGGSATAPTSTGSQAGGQQQQQPSFGTFAASSLRRLVLEATEAVASMKDWDRLWDVVRTKFVKPMPILVHHETSGTSKDDAIMIDDDDDDDSTSDVVLEMETISLHQVEQLAWELFCVGWRCMPQVSSRNASATTGFEGDSSAANKMRRLRLTVAAGALVLFTALYEASFPERDSTGGTEDDPPGKRLRVATLSQTLVDAIKDPGAKRTRYGTMHSTADALVDGSITASEIEEQAEALAALIWSVTAASTPPSAAARRQDGPVTTSSKIEWLRKVELSRFGDESSGYFFLSADRVIPLLAKTVTNLYYDTNVKSSGPDGFVYDVGTLMELDSLESLDDPRHDRLYARIADEFSSANRTAAEPIVFTDAMELNEWSVSLMNIQVVKPCPNLFQMIEYTQPGTLTKHVIPSLNRVLHRIGEEFVTESQASRQMSVYVVDPGRVVINGEESSDKKFARAVVALYYHALEAILYCERERLRASLVGEPASEAKNDKPVDDVDEILHKRLISSHPFHSALLTCSLLCVHKAVGGTQLMMNHLHSFSALHVCECYPEDFLKVSDSFRRCLSGNTPARGNVGSGLVLDIPRLLWKEIQTAERNTLDVFLWKGEVNSFMGKIEGLRERRFWPPDCLGPDDDDDPDVEDAKSKVVSRKEGYSELRSVAHVFRRIMTVAWARIVSLLEFLYVHPRPVVARQVYVALRHVLRRHVELLHDRHLDHMILCCLYGVGKQLPCEPPITFATLIDAYVAVRGPEEGDITCQRIVRHIKLDTAMNDTDDEPVGNIIQLYNLVFVPLMKDYLLKSTSLQRAAARMKDTAADQRHQESVAGAIQLSIQGRRGATGTFQGNSGFLRGRLDHSGSVTAVEIGSPSSYKAAEVANELTRQRVAN